MKDKEDIIKSAKKPAAESLRSFIPKIIPNKKVYKRNKNKETEEQ